jgi:hypothetical protein
VYRPPTDPLIEMSPLLAILVVEGTTLGLPVVIAGTLALRRRHWLSLAAAADRAETAGIAQAGDTVLHGVVEADGDVPPVRVEIDQRGYQGLWTETKRRTVVAPFHLRTAAGDRVRVEPDPRVLLVRPLDRTIERGKHLRTRVAELSAGDAVHVAGALEPAVPSDGPYRGDPRPATLRPPARGQLTISASPLREQFDQRAAYLASKALGVLFIALAAHCLVDALWRFDMQQLAIRASGTVTVVRYAAMVGFAGLAFAFFFARRPWYAGKLQEDERRRRV